MKRRIKEIISLLSEVYERPEPSLAPSPLDELILTILSQNTNDVNRDKAFYNLKRLFPSWEDAWQTTPETIEQAIRVGGLARQKSLRIHKILDGIKQEHGEVSLDFLSEMSIQEAHDYLVLMKGVGEKTIACVLLFSLKLPAFPVDTHVHRLAQRLELVKSGSNEDSTMNQILASTDPEDRYALHILLITHGRKVCHARKPSCLQCVLAAICPSCTLTSTDSGTSA